MSKPKTASPSAWQATLSEIFQVGVYKRTQGRVTRQVTFGSLLIVVVLASWKLYVTLQSQTHQALLLGGAPLLLMAAGIWLAYRLVNVSRFAEFLINVEAEMAKVSWSSRTELFRSSAVVIVVMVVLAVILFFFDFVWQFIFSFLGVSG